MRRHSQKAGNRGHRSQHPVLENISTIAEMEERFLQGRTGVERLSDTIGSFADSMTFVVLHVIVILFWFVVNTGSGRPIPKFDPYPFVLLNMAVSVEAVLLSTFVLMKQNRESRRAEHRQQLNLQIDLLSEREATKSLQLLNRICERLDIRAVKQDEEIEILSENTAVAELAEELKKKLPPA